MEDRTAETDPAPAVPLAYYTGDDSSAKMRLRGIMQVAAYVSLGVGVTLLLSGIGSVGFVVLSGINVGKYLFSFANGSLVVLADAVIGGVLLRSSWRFLRGNHNAARWIVWSNIAYVAVTTIFWLFGLMRIWQCIPPAKGIFFALMGLLASTILNAAESLPLALYALLSVYIFSRRPIDP